jgi:hypothetical protein
MSAYRLSFAFAAALVASVAGAGSAGAAVIHNAITHNAITHNALEASGSDLDQLNGVAVPPRRHRRRRRRSNSRWPASSSLIERLNGARRH